MGSVIDTKQQIHCFPISPPSSGNVTALSSPHLHPLGSIVPDLGDNLFQVASVPTFGRSNSRASDPLTQQSNTKVADPEHHISERTSHRPSRRHVAARKEATRAVTLPSHTSIPMLSLSTSPPKSTRPLSRQSSDLSSSSSSSPSTSPEHTPQLSSGIGRKVAASLQLFKESIGTPAEEVQPREPQTSTGMRRACSSSKVDDVAEAQYQFVKRSAWPDREAAAVRRESSVTTMKKAWARESVVVQDTDSPRGKERKSLVRDNVVNDLTERRKEVVNSGRGRRRERGVDDLCFDIEVDSDLSLPTSNIHDIHDLTFATSPFTRSLSRAYPPSPSPSRSPTSRVPPLSLHHISTEPSPRPSSFRGGVSSPTQPTTLQTALTLSSEIDPPITPLDPLDISPWSTDDESTWESASVTASTSTTSTNDCPFSPTQSLHHSSINHNYQHLHGSAPSNVAFGAGIGESEEDDYLTQSGDFSEEHLPHIPLRPFRNQVGGHSAIYKFTKRAVCKPLVSRENLFYESVEREAPPLLGFIPRYLGVMLVSYRRVPKGATASEMPTPKCTSIPSEAVQSLQPIRPLKRKVTNPPRSSASIPISSATIHEDLPEEEGANDTDTAESEMPEVVLDRNRHIIPEWMLGGRRNRSLSHSNASSCHPRPLTRARLNEGTASSPDLGLVNISYGDKPNPLARYQPFVSEMGVPTPANSPSRSRHAIPSVLPSDGRFAFSSSEEGEYFERPNFRTFRSEQPSQSPGWFGGTGSTVVNTKLKDRVFSTVLRRFHRRTGGRWVAGSGTEEEVDFADGEGEMYTADERPNIRRTRKLTSQTGRRKDAESDSCSPIRRIHSESMIPTPKSIDAIAAWERRHGMMEVLDSDYDQNNGSKGINTSQEVELPPSMSRQRSRSRSLGAPCIPVPTSHWLSGRAAIPEHETDPSVTRQNHFILMEDLTGRLKHSCVMDLKMGTRQYGMDATSSKKKSQRKKCDRTTSRSLGVRVCGMQFIYLAPGLLAPLVLFADSFTWKVWNHVTQSYMTQDKYMGREVLPEEFSSVLASFLFDGERLLAYQIPVLLQKLYALARIINRLKGYRFYGCSLLLIYDGDRDVQEAFWSSMLEHPSSRTKRGESLELQTPRSKSDTKHAKPPLRRSHSEDLLFGPVSNGRRKRGEINVRIVDFAHTTTGRDWVPYPTSDRTPTHEASSMGYQAEVDPSTGLIYARFPPHYPNEPDRGFLFGLKNLATNLEQIWNDERIRRIKASRDDPSVAASRLPPLLTDGKEVFEDIFGADEDPGTIST